MQENNTKKKVWFKRKRYGWGWGLPMSWEGWLVLALYLAALIYIFRSVNELQPSGNITLIDFGPRLIIVSLALIAICYWKGEKPRWTWGDDKDSV